ncbi:NAD-dependent epimerase/dehydratase family protein [Bacteroides sp. 224]|uniref:NAD-dependent epimerase/dehydratase family protein n=1 Tax=Bacteroides sp. 224 TaxID=2302936 RepID=UPI0013D5E889|nr:NAD-dependent epimerase/dehydratase family protein [Bacteroides sp. 224]NDV65700.1 NAD-dependent epimerase/dehydratase family protein [Bacteroides sp. 224]
MVFVTGGSGLVGGHLLIQLVKQNEQIRALKRANSQFKELRIICEYYQMEFDKVMAQIEWIEGDLLNPESLNNTLAGIHTVYHCAAIVSFGESSPNTLLQTNITGTQNLLEASLKNSISCFAFVSSIGALGQSQNGETVTEETPWNLHNTSSVYSNSKYAAEQEVWKASGMGLPVVIVNPGIILGAGDASKGSLLLYSKFKNGIPFYTPQRTGYVDVRDVCRALIMLVHQKVYNQRFILVSENLSNRELFTFIAKAVGKRPPFISVGKKGLLFAKGIERMITFISGRKPLLTSEIITSAVKQESYSSEKIREAYGFTFTNMEETISSSIHLSI